MKNLLYNLSCNVLYIQQNYPATNQNQKQPSMSILCTLNTYWANSANDLYLAVKLRPPKNSHRQFQYRLSELVCEAGRAWPELP